MYNATYKLQCQAIVITLSLFCTILHTIKQRSGNRAFHFTYSFPDLNFRFYILNFQFTLYPASSTAFFRTESSTFFDIVRTAEPFSWLTSAYSTPSVASRVFFTVASQCGHIIPSIFIVFSMILFSFLFLCFIFLSCFEL